MSADYGLTVTTGLAGGEKIQFAEGRWPGVLGPGVTMTEEGLDIVEPHLRAVAPDWDPMHRYGVFDLNAEARKELVPRLRSKAADLRTRADAEARADLLEGLATWLEARLDERIAVSILGL